MIKKLFFLLSIILIIPNAFSILEITIEDISPSPVEPGESLVIELKLINTESETVDINKINLDLKNNFILKSINNNYEGETLCSKCSKSLIYYLNSKSDLESGIYSIDIDLTYDNTYSAKKEVLIKVQGEPKLILDANLNSKISPEKKFNLNLSISNLGSNDAKNIKISSISEEIGFLNENFLFIKEIKQSQKINIQGELFSSKEIKTGYYRIPLLIEYEDSQNNKYEVTEKIGIEILDNANIILQHLDIPSEIFVGETFQLAIRVENDGAGKANEVNVVLDGEIEGSKKAYFGTIDKDEDLPYIFNLIPVTSKETILNLIITFKDDFGEHEISYPITISAKMSNSIFNNIYYQIGTGIFIFLLIIFILIKKNNNKENY